MSSEACVAAQIFDLAELFSALKDLKKTWQQIDKLETSDGKAHDVEGVFVDGMGRKAGLQKTPEGYRIITDTCGLNADQLKMQTESVQQVVQRYAYRKVLKELQTQGYVVAEEEKRPDNTIRLIVRKWV